MLMELQCLVMQTTQVTGDGIVLTGEAKYKPAQLDLV